MEGTWHRVLAGGVMIVVALGLGSVEVLKGRPYAERPVPPVPTAPAPSNQAPTPWQGFLVEQGNLLAMELGPPMDWDSTSGADTNLTEAIQTNRQTVLKVDRGAHRLVSVNGLGRVRVSEVSDQALVLTEDKKAADLATLTVGDLIKVEPGAGRVQRIVVLRHAWSETGSPEQ